MASKTQALSGKDANFFIGAFDYSDIFNMVGLSTTRDKADVTTLADLGKAYVPGHFDGTLRLSGIFSAEEDQVLQSYVDEASEPFPSTLILGSAKGDRAKLSNIVTSEYGIDTPVDDKASISGSGQASGLMHHCVALSNVGASVTAAAAGTTVVLKDLSTAPNYIDLGATLTKWKRVRVHVHATSIPATTTKLELIVKSGTAVAANAITGPTNRNGANGFDFHDDGFYAFEFVAAEGANLDRYWSFELKATGTGNTVYTVAFGRSQE